MLYFTELTGEGITNVIHLHNPGMVLRTTIAMSYLKLFNTKNTCLLFERRNSTYHMSQWKRKCFYGHWIMVYILWKDNGLMEIVICSPWYITKLLPPKFIKRTCLPFFFWSSPLLFFRISRCESEVGQPTVYRLVRLQGWVYTDDKTIILNSTRCGFLLLEF